jgi:ADP-heptose:LPS heptosyltransferase
MDREVRRLRIRRTKTELKQDASVVQRGDDILKLLVKEGAEAAKKTQRGLILQPGAIGDCLLTLPLVGFMKESLGLGSVDILGHAEYIGILPGRSCVDGIRSMDSVELHRLFAESGAFDLAQDDPLINAFADYAWIVTFLGEPDSNFEQNLIFTANCSHSAAVIPLPLKPPEEYRAHIADFYIEQFAVESGTSVAPQRTDADSILITATDADARRGQEMLKEMEIDYSEQVVVIHPGSGSCTKCWHVENFMSLAEQVGRLGWEVIFLPGPAEVERFSEATMQKISSLAKCLTDLSLVEVLGLLRCVDSFVGNDSGITHLAAGLGVKTFAVFGPTNPALYRPIGPAVHVFRDASADFAQKPSERLQREVVDTLCSL